MRNRVPQPYMPLTIFSFGIKDLSLYLKLGLVEQRQ